MTLKESADILERHNRWRRGGKGKQLSPDLIGRAIDTAVAALRRRKPRKKGRASCT